MTFLLDFDPITKTLMIIFIASLFALSLILKAWALWKAAKNNHKIWFITLLFINTLGIVEIAYLILDKTKFNSVNKEIKNGTKEK